MVFYGSVAKVRIPALPLWSLLLSSFNKKHLTSYLTFGLNLQVETILSEACEFIILSWFLFSFLPDFSPSSHSPQWNLCSHEITFLNSVFSLILSTFAFCQTNLSLKSHSLLLYTYCSGKITISWYQWSFSDSFSMILFLKLID